MIAITRIVLVAALLSLVVYLAKTMRYRSLLILAAVFEGVLIVGSVYADHIQASLSTGIMMALLQMPGLAVAKSVLSEAASVGWFFALTFIFQVLFLSSVLCGAKFIIDRSRNLQPSTSK